MSALWWLSFAQGALLLLAAPALLGWINWWKSRLAGRQRPLAFVLQPYRDLGKLLKVPPACSQATSWVFRWTPIILFVAYGSLLFALPLFTAPFLNADLIVVLYLLGLARFTFSLAGLDGASAFGGLGSQREMFFHVLTEVSFFALIAAFLLWSDGGATIEASTGLRSLLQILASVALLPAFFPVILLEARRLPVDNPDTHLGLTMADKGVGSEYAGRDLALVEWTETNKLVFLLALWSQLFVSLFVPASSDVIAAIVAVIKVVLWLLAGVILAYWEWCSPKVRLGQVPLVAQASLLLSLFAILLRLTPGG